MSVWDDEHYARTTRDLRLAKLHSPKLSRSLPTNEALIAARKAYIKADSDALTNLRMALAAAYVVDFPKGAS